MREHLDTFLSAFKVPTLVVEGFTVNSIAAVTLGIGFLLAFLAMRGKGVAPKVVAGGSVVLLAGGIAWAQIEQLSYPKELSTSWLQAQGINGVSIHSAIVNPPERIHLYMDIDGEPRNFFVAWSKELEESLQKALEEQRKSGGADLRLRFEPSLEEYPMAFYALPWPAPAPKDERPLQSDPFVIEREV